MTPAASTRQHPLDGSELTYKLATRAACLLEKSPGRRLATFEEMTEFYGIRSEIVHDHTKRKHRKLGCEDFELACNNGRDLACATLSAILRHGCFPDWKQIIFDAEDRRPARVGPARPQGPASRGSPEHEKIRAGYQLK